MGASLLAFIIVYFAVYAAGIFYLLRLFANSPDRVNAELDHGPMHAAGITGIAIIEREDIKMSHPNIVIPAKAGSQRQKPPISIVETAESLDDDNNGSAAS